MNGDGKQNAFIPFIAAMLFMLWVSLLCVLANNLLLDLMKFYIGLGYYVLVGFSLFGILIGWYRAGNIDNSAKRRRVYIQTFLISLACWVLYILPLFFFYYAAIP